jgi:hypothetical protein
MAASPVEVLAAETHAPLVAFNIADVTLAIMARPAPDVVGAEIRRHHQEHTAPFVEGCARSWDAATGALWSW